MKPLWKQFFDSVEQAAAPVMADATASSGFAEIMKAGVKISRDMNRQAEAVSRQWLHALNLPAAGDISYLKTQVGSLEAEVRTLRRTIETLTVAVTPDAQVAGPATQATGKATRSPAKKTAAKKPVKKLEVA